MTPAPQAKRLSDERLKSLRCLLEQSDPRDMTSHWSDGSLLQLLDHCQAVELDYAEVVLAAADLADWCERNNQAIDLRSILKDRLDTLAYCHQKNHPSPFRLLMERIAALEAAAAAREEQYAELVEAVKPLCEIWQGIAPKSTMQQFNATIMSNDLMPPIVAALAALNPTGDSDGR